MEYAQIRGPLMVCMSRRGMWRWYSGMCVCEARARKAERKRIQTPKLRNIDRYQTCVLHPDADQDVRKSKTHHPTAEQKTDTHFTYREPSVHSRSHPI
eukprot:3675448-Prymnesium_polylepis.2